MMIFIDFRYDWESSQVIICLKWTDTNHHFYVREFVESEEEADEIVSRWEMQCSMFYDVEYQHPN